MGITIPFPVIADLNMKVAKKYGMIHPGQSSTAAVRCVFLSMTRDHAGNDLLSAPEREVHAEIIRLVKALQTTDTFKVSTPANWQPGDKVVVPPPKTAAEMERRLSEGMNAKTVSLLQENLKIYSFFKKSDQILNLFSIAATRKLLCSKNPRICRKSTEAWQF